jgi:hypothetical protein
MKRRRRIDLVERDLREGVVHKAHALEQRRSISKTDVASGTKIEVITLPL